MAKDRTVDFDVLENNKTTKDRWEEYEARRDALDQSFVQNPTQQKYAIDTVTSSTDSVKKASNETSRIVSGDYFSRFTSWVTSFFTTPQEESTEQVQEIAKTGASPITAPKIPAPVPNDEAKLKKCIDELLEHSNAIKNAKDDQDEDKEVRKKSYPLEYTFVMLLAMAEERRLNEMAGQEELLATNQFRKKNQEYQLEIMDTSKHALDIEQSSKTMGTISSYASMANTGLIVGTLAVNGVAAFLTGGTSIPATLFATLPGLVTKLTAATAITTGVTKIYKAHLDHKSELHQAEKVSMQGKRDISKLHMGSHMQQFVYFVSHSLSIVTQMKQNLDHYSATMDAIKAK